MSNPFAYEPSALEPESIPPPFESDQKNRENLADIGFNAVINTLLEKLQGIIDQMSQTKSSFPRFPDSSRSLRSLILYENANQPLEHIEVQVFLYKTGLISSGQAAARCNLSLDQFLREVKRKGLELEFGPESLEEAEDEVRLLREYLDREG